MQSTRTRGGDRNGSTKQVSNTNHSISLYATAYQTWTVTRSYYYCVVLQVLSRLTLRRMLMRSARAEVAAWAQQEPLQGRGR